MVAVDLGPEAMYKGVRTSWGVISVWTVRSSAQESICIIISLSILYHVIK